MVQRQAGMAAVRADTASADTAIATGCDRFPDRSGLMASPSGGAFLYPRG